MAYNMDRWRELLPDGWRPSWLPQMPFTDYHQLNLDWIIETVKEWTERLIAFFDEDGAKDLVEDVLEEHPEWVTTVQDGSLTYKKLVNGTLGFITPEMYGAVGDGVTDDTAAWIAALATGKDIYGANTYLVGTGHTGSANVLTIAHPCTIKAKLIDNRPFSTTAMNLRNWGLFGLESDSVNLDIEVIGNNNLPVDDEDANNLSDVAGYAIVGSKTEPISNCNISLTVENVNGFGWSKTVKDSIIKIYAKHSAYPWANWYGVGCSIILNCEEVHRTFWGALESSTAFVYCKDFVSTGNSGHFLLTNYTDDDNTEHLGDNVKIYIYDTGSTQFNAGAPYFMVNMQTESTATINAEVWVSGDINDTNYNQSTFTITQNATITGSLVIHDDLKTKTTVPSRMLGMLDNLIVYADVPRELYYHPKTTSNGNVSIYGDAAVFLKNFNGVGYFYGVKRISSGSPADTTSVTGTIYAHSCGSVQNFTNATIYNYSFPTTHLYDPVITQKAGQRVQFGGVCTGIGVSLTSARIIVPLPFVDTQHNYTVTITALGITGVISSTQGAQFITNTYKYDNSIMLEYVNADTSITNGRSYQCNYSITITFT